MTTEYALINVAPSRKLTIDMVEEKINALARKGWKIKGTVNTSWLILTRDVMFPAIKDVL